jgi:outer membrane protein assembly factor BamB
MDDLGKALEERRRSFQPSPGGFDRLAARRRRQRRERTVAAVSALVLAGAGLYAVTQALRPGGRLNAHVPISPRDAARLHLVWTAPIESGFASSIAAGDHEVYVHSTHKGLSAFPSSCPTRQCDPLWTTPLLGPGTEAAPIVVGSRVYVTSDRLVGFPASCAVRLGQCAPIVTEPAPVRGQQLSAPAVWGDRIYVGAMDGRLLAYATGCDKRSGCGPVWAARTGGSLLNSTPAISHGLVYVMSDRLYAFPVACPQLCRPRWVAAISDAFTAPVSGGGMAFVSHDDRLFAFSPSCAEGGRACRPSWTFQDPAGVALSTPTVLGGMVYVLGSRLFAFPTTCGAGGIVCAPRWSGDIGATGFTAPPTAADGLIFVSGERLLAFPATCPSMTCRAVWESGAAGQALARPVATPDTLYVASAEGKLSAFEVGAR